MTTNTRALPSTPRDLAPFIDHTLLKPNATRSEIEGVCREAIENQFKAVCVNPTFVNLAREQLESSQVLTVSVIGFPFGCQLSSVKALEAELALRDGANEIDMVLRLDFAAEGLWLEAERDIAEVVRASAGKVVKVILETGLLTISQLVTACRVSENAGAKFVKTATGFLGRGATLEDIHLMRSSCSERMQIKASGGIKTFKQAQAMIAAGATRLGTSSGVALVTGGELKDGY